MLKEAENIVKIEGTILNNKLSEWTSSDGRVFVRGEVTIRVPLEDKGIISDIPVRVFVSQKTRQGSTNPAYSSVLDLMKAPTIETAGEEGAACVSITKAKIGMNEYAKNDKIVSFPSVSASFFKVIDKAACKPEASFRITGVVATKPDYKTDAEDNVLGYFLNLVVPQYGGVVDLVPFKAANDKVIQVMDTNWYAGDTVSFGGYLNFATEEIVKEVEVDFGEPEKRVYTNHVSEFVISRGSSAPMDGDNAYDADEIKKAMSDRKAKHEELKEKAKAKAAATPAPVKPEESSDLGF